jgi:outer membrane protein
MRGSLITSVAVAGVLFPGAAWAQADAARPIFPTDWTVEIGVGGRMVPSYEGSGRYAVWPFPIFGIREAGTPRHFSSPRDGVGFAIVDFGGFRFGPAGKLVLPRTESDNLPALRGLGNVDWTVEIGGFAEYWFVPWLRTRVEVRQGIGGHEGIVSDITADVVVPATAQLQLSAGPRLTLATAEALRPYYGVDAAQSAASGLPVFQPNGGVKSFGFGAQAREQWTPQWATNLYVEYDRLVGDAAKSPVLTRNGSADQVTVGLGFSYTFDVSLR